MNKINIYTCVIPYKNIRFSIKVDDNVKLYMVGIINEKDYVYIRKLKDINTAKNENTIPILHIPVASFQFCFKPYNEVNEVNELTYQELNLKHPQNFERFK